MSIILHRSKLRLDIATERWPVRRPVKINGHVFHDLEVVVVTLISGDCRGRGEAVGLYYAGDTPAGLAATLETVRADIERGASREDAQRLLPAGGARNALDCAYWSLEAAEAGQPVWQLAGLPAPRPLLTTYTCGVDDPEQVGAAALAYKHARAIKLKLAGDGMDTERVRIVRAARPDVWIGVDANQALDPARFERLLPTLVEAKVELVEQPFPVGCEPTLAELKSPIAVAGDESIQSLADVERAVGRFDAINIKLDKTGGLTEAIACARRAKALGLQLMVGNMMGTSLATAPAFLVGQLCSIVDLDGPIFLTADLVPGVSYTQGRLNCADEVWANGFRDGGCR